MILNGTDLNGGTVLELTDKKKEREKTWNSLCNPAVDKQYFTYM